MAGPMLLYFKEASAASKPPTLKEAIQLVGAMGGHLGRKHDGHPGRSSTLARSATTGYCDGDVYHLPIRTILPQALTNKVRS